MTAEVSVSAPSNRRPSRWVSWVLFAIIGAPMTLAYLIYSTGWGVPSGTINRGDLLLPATSVTDLILHDERGNSLNLWQDKKKWRILIVGSNQCSDACLNSLYLSRQVHIRLGEKARRVERVFLNTDAYYSESLLQTLNRDHPRLITASVNAEQWQQHFEATTAAQHSVDGSYLYFVDQAGFAMMSFDQSHQGSDLLDDIKRLLKYSYED